MTSPFKYFKTGYSVDQIPDLTGKVAIVTGGNTGLGYETILQFLKKGARVFMASRSEDRALAAIEKLKTEVGEEAGKRVEFLKLDLQDLKQVKAAAQEFLAKKLPLNILVNNAGIAVVPFALTKDGIESQLGTNHVGHYLFTLTLLPALEQATPSRVVNVSSGAHFFAPKEGVLFDKINDEAALSAFGRYGQSKLANILFTKGFDKRFGDRGILANALHPGAVQTELGRGVDELWGLNEGWKAYLLRPLLNLMFLLLITPKDGALTQIYAATSPEVEQKPLRGQYFVPYARLAGPSEISEAAQNEELVEKLWEWTEKAVEGAWGIMACPFALTRDGIESQLGTNHVGHYLFTVTLLPALEQAAPSRVVNLSSYGHNFAPKEGILFDKIQDEKYGNAWTRYGQSKLANILFAKGFDKRFGDKGIFSNAVHPGVVETELVRGPKDLYGLNKGFLAIFAPLLNWLNSWMSINVQQGALTQIYVATSPDIEEKKIRGKYFIPFAYELDGDGLSALAKSEAEADKLWEWSEKIVAEKLAA